MCEETLIRCEICGNYHNENRVNFYDINDMTVCETCVDYFIEGFYTNGEPTDKLCIVCNNPCKDEGYYLFEGGIVCEPCIDLYKDFRRRD